MAAEKLW